MKAYLKTAKELLSVSAKRKMDRTGVGTSFKVFNEEEFNLKFGGQFPIVTTKQVAIRAVIGELLGFIRAADSAATFRELDCNVWNANANQENETGSKNAWLRSPWRKGEDDLGRIYGVQWREWDDTRISNAEDHQRFLRDGYKAVAQFDQDGQRKVVWNRKVDQLQQAVNLIQKNPESRRIIISGWNPSDLDKGALPPCHILQHFICEPLGEQERIEAHIKNMENEAIWNGAEREIIATNVRNHILHLFNTDSPSHEQLDEYNLPRYKLNLVVYQRSADWLLGVPFNISSYATMINIMSRITGTAPGTLHYCTGDTHLYNNHRNAMKEQTTRTPSSEITRLLINPQLKTLEDFEQASPSDFRLFNYQHQGKLKNPAPMAI